MTIEYTFINQDTALATIVCVTNLYAPHPVQACDGSPVAGGDFHYLPWQCLNASAGAREFFRYEGRLSAVARQDGATPVLDASVPTPLIPGRRYLAFPDRRTLSVAQVGETGGEATAMTAVSLGIESFALAVDWFLDQSPAGTTSPLAPSQAALFCAGDTLLFYPVAPERLPQRLTPAELASATRYRAPTYARRVTVTLSQPAGGPPVYDFMPPSAAH